MSPQQCGERYLSPCAKRRNQSATPSLWRRPTVYPRRSRGTQRPGVLYAIPKRFIPADAGNTHACEPATRTPTVYPRRCGEHGRQRRRRARHPRFIPAGAGNTGPEPRRLSRPPVYPRRCGEHPRTLVRHLKKHGLSPQVRGTHLPSVRERPERRFIPAGAGNTSATANAATSVAVYPRRCGEHTTSVGANGLSTGLSPQVRGTPSTMKTRR